MGSFTANEVSQMHNDLEKAQETNKNLEATLAMVMSERDTLKTELDLVRAKADRELVRATEMRTIIEQTSAQLVEGLRRMVTHERSRMDVAIRQVQEEKPPVKSIEKNPSPDDDDLPVFLSKPPLNGIDYSKVEPKTILDSDDEPEDRLPKPEFAGLPGLTKSKVAPIDTTLADKDSRLPRSAFMSEQDANALAELIHHGE